MYSSHKKLVVLHHLIASCFCNWPNKGLCSQSIQRLTYCLPMQLPNNKNRFNKNSQRSKSSSHNQFKTVFGELNYTRHPAQQQNLPPMFFNVKTLPVQDGVLVRAFYFYANEKTLATAFCDDGNSCLRATAL